MFNVEYHLNSVTPAGLARPFDFDGSRTRHHLVLNGRLPLTRILERNSYRAALIGWQRQRRTVMAAEDNTVAAVRQQLRSLRVLAETYRIQQRAVELGYLRVELALDTLQAPPIPGATGDNLALTEQLLQALSSLVQAQNDLITTWINYLTARMQLYRDLELINLDERGVWIDDVATCQCPPEQSADQPRPVKPEGH